MNKRQMLKAIRLMSNEVILQEAGRRGLALIELPNSPYRNKTRTEFAKVVSNTKWEQINVENNGIGFQSDERYYRLRFVIEGKYKGE